MKTEAEIRGALIHLILGNFRQPADEDIAVMRALSWILELGIAGHKPFPKNPRPKRRRFKVASDHFAI